MSDVCLCVLIAGLCFFRRFIMITNMTSYFCIRAGGITDAGREPNPNLPVEETHS